MKNDQFFSNTICESLSSIEEKIAELEKNTKFQPLHLAKVK